jgi:uncharacterized phage-associated protein
MYRYNSIVFAKYLLSKILERRFDVNMTKLQKLLYISYGVYLAIKDERLTNEMPKAWPYGPVFPSTRKALLKIDIISYNISGDGECSEISEDEEMDGLVNLVLRTFGTWTTNQLVDWTHNIDSPWDRTQSSSGFKWNQTIPDEYTKEYFSDIISYDKERY